ERSHRFARRVLREIQARVNAVRGRALRPLHLMPIRVTIALSVLLFGVFAAGTALQQPCSSTPASTASVEGVVVKLGSNEPITGVDLELIRVGGTRCA